jgi:HAD superfamily hydrolase (TIGR01549 family)
MPATVILDIDGTLVDSNYQHAIAWYRAFRGVELTLPVWRIHRHIGMGGDKLVAAVAGDDVEREHGDEIRDREKDLYAELIDEVAVLDGARDLIVALDERGHEIVLASSAKEDEVDHYLDLLDARDLAKGWTTSADVDATKPEPDLVKAALDKAGTDEAVMIGDTPWDAIAAARAGVPCIGVLTGGFAAGELAEAGARPQFEAIPDLLDRLRDTPLDELVTAA